MLRLLVRKGPDLSAPVQGICHERELLFEECLSQECETCAKQLVKPLARLLGFTFFPGELFFKGIFFACTFFF